MKSKNDKIIIDNIPELFNIKIVSGIDIINDFSNHIHDHYIIGIIDDGKRELVVNENILELKAGDVFIINENESHRCSSLDNIPHSYKVICLSHKSLRQIAGYDALDDSSYIVFENAIISDDNLYKELSSFFYILEYSDSILEKESLFYSLIENLIVNYSNSYDIDFDVNAYNPVNTIKNYIEKNFKENLSLNDLSELINLSPYYLNRIFCKEIGVSPHMYLIQMRIEKSKELLRDGLPIIDVAQEMGFADQSHFTKFFKKIIGVTPGRFIKYNSYM